VFTERVPLLTGSVQAGTTVVNGQQVYVEATDLFRQTATSVGGILSYPLSRATRVEFGTSAQRVSFDHRVQTQLFDPFSGQLLSDQTSKLTSEPSLNLFDTSAALVRDTAAFGAVGPILGQRLRIEGAPTFGGLNMFTVSTDLRQYVMPFQPLTLAGRALHVGRYGGSSEDERLTPLFLGYSTLVRGYNVGSFDASECVPTATSSCPAFDRLVGSRIAVFNGEARVPLVGLFTGKLDYGPVPVELFGFFDTGVAWTRSEGPSFSSGVRSFVSSAGAGARVNVFGFLITELNMVKPLDRPGRGWQFVFNLRPSF
jgi:outer membrane protein assembly factor BamA